MAVETDQDLAGDLYALIVYLHAQTHHDLVERVIAERSTVNQLKLLGYLRGGRRPTVRQVGMLLGGHPNSASRVVAQLAQRGLVRRVTDEKDTRVKRVEITDAGDQLIAKLHAARYGQVVQFVDELDDEQREDLRRLLEPLASRRDIAVFRPQEPVE